MSDETKPLWIQVNDSLFVPRGGVSYIYVYEGDYPTVQLTMVSGAAHLIHGEFARKLIAEAKAPDMDAADGIRAVVPPMSAIMAALSPMSAAMAVPDVGPMDLPDYMEQRDWYAMFEALKGLR